MTVTNLNNGSTSGLTSLENNPSKSRMKMDVYDMDGRKIAKTDQELTVEFLQYLCSEGPPVKPAKSIRDYPWLIQEFRDFCSHPPFDRIFNTEKICQETVQLMSRARIFPIIIESLIYFKKYDHYTYRHLIMVAALASRMAHGLGSIYRHCLEAGSVTPSHDIGKLAVPSEILKKTDALTTDEIDIIRSHVEAGLVLLTYYLGEEDPLSCQVTYEHHELMDGSGYPRQIRQTNELIQLVTVCDMFDALISVRPYRKENYTLRGALELLSDAANGGKMNSDCVKILISYNRAEKPHWQDIEISREHRERTPLSIKHDYIQPKIPESDKPTEPDSNPA